MFPLLRSSSCCKKQHGSQLCPKDALTRQRDQRTSAYTFHPVKTMIDSVSDPQWLTSLLVNTSLSFPLHIVLLSLTSSSILQLFVLMCHSLCGCPLSLHPPPALLNSHFFHVKHTITHLYSISYILKLAQLCFLSWLVGWRAMQIKR